MDKETLLKILKLSKDEGLSEKDACIRVLGKYKKLYTYKIKYGIQPNQQGKGPQNGKSKKYEVNDYYFNDKSLKSCYYAGFLAADGNINKEYSQIRVGVAIKDENFLKEFNKDLNSTYLIKYNNTNNFKQCTLVITSLQICEDLKNYYNIVPNKSLILTPPKELTKAQMDCFIMGLIDGDGSINLVRHGSNNSLSIACVGTIPMMQFIKNRFEEILGCPTTNLYVRDSSKNYCSYRIGDKKARTIFKFYMENYFSIPSLHRKWNPEILQYCNSFKKNLPISKRKGVYIFNLEGKQINFCETLKDAEVLTGVSCGRISNLCKADDSRHMAKGYMFSRNKIIMSPYIASSSTNIVYKNMSVHKEDQDYEAGIVNREDEDL